MGSLHILYDSDRALPMSHRRTFCPSLKPYVFHVNVPYPFDPQCRTLSMYLLAVRFVSSIRNSAQQDNSYTRAMRTSASHQ